MATVIARDTVRVAGPVAQARIQKGDTFDDADPVVRSNPWLFAAPDEYAEEQSRPKSTAELGDRSMSVRNVEQATAGPGEQRNTRYYCDVDGCRSWATSEQGLEEHVAEEHQGDE